MDNLDKILKSNELKPVLNLRKLKTWVPLLKKPVGMLKKSRVVYEIKGPTGVTRTALNLSTQFREYARESVPVQQHFDQCNAKFGTNYIKLTDLSSSEFGAHLFTIGVLALAQRRPSIITCEKFP